MHRNFMLVESLVGLIHEKLLTIEITLMDCPHDANPDDGLRTECLKIVAGLAAINNAVRCPECLDELGNEIEGG